MHASHAGPLASYNSLLDKNLAGYFTDHRRFKHLRRMGLVTKDGRIVDEGIIRMNAARKQHKQFSRELLADTIVTRAVELERKRRADLKKKLEQLEKIEKVEKVKSQRCHPAGIQDFNPYRSAPPPPPRLSKTFETHINDLGLSLDQISDVRQAVSKISRNRTIPPPRADSPYASHSLVTFPSTPTVHTPRPPSNPRPNTPGRSRATVRSGRRSRPSTAPVGGQRAQGGSTLNQNSPLRAHRHSDVKITLCYVGKSLHLEGRSLSEVVVLQQHCGGNTIQLYKGHVRPKERFSFTSKRHIGMPFGLTFYLDGMMDSRISACCEYRHQCGKLLGSKTAHFGLVKVEGGKPCYRCEIERDRNVKRQRQQAEVDSILNNPQVSPRVDQLENTFNESPSTTPPPPFGLSSQSEIISTHQTNYEQEFLTTALPNDNSQPPHVISQEDIEESKLSVNSDSHSSLASSNKSIDEEEKSVASSHNSLHQEDNEKSETEDHHNTPVSPPVLSHSNLHSQGIEHLRPSTMQLTRPSDASGIYSTSAQTNLLDVTGDSVVATDSTHSVTLRINEADHQNSDYSDYDDDVFEEDDDTLPEADVTNKSTDPAENVTPVDTAENVTPVDTAENIAPVDTAENVTPVDTAENVTPVDTAENVTPVDTAENVTPVDTAENVTPVDTAENVTPVDTAENVTPVDPVDIQVESETKVDPHVSETLVDDEAEPGEHLDADEILDVSIETEETTKPVNSAESKEQSVDNSETHSTDGNLNGEVVQDSQNEDEVDVNKQPHKDNETETSTLAIPIIVEPKNEELNDTPPESMVQTDGVEEKRLLDAPPSVVVIAATPDSEQTAIDKFSAVNLKSHSDQDDPASEIQVTASDSQVESPGDASQSQNLRPSILVTNKATPNNKNTQLRSVSFSDLKSPDLKTPSISPSTIIDASKILQKITSNSSLNSLLNDGSIDEGGSVVDLSGSEDELIPNLEKKITQLENSVGFDGAENEGQETIVRGETGNTDEDKLSESNVGSTVHIGELDPEAQTTPEHQGSDSTQKESLIGNRTNELSSEISLNGNTEEPLSGQKTIENELTTADVVEGQTTTTTTEENGLVGEANSVKSSLSSSLSKSSLTSVSSNDSKST